MFSKKKGGGSRILLLVYYSFHKGALLLATKIWWTGGLESGEDPKEVRRQQQTQLLGDCYLKVWKHFVSAKGPSE
jgi:hypothetical protein